MTYLRGKSATLLAAQLLVVMGGCEAKQEMRLGESLPVSALDSGMAQEEMDSGPSVFEEMEIGALEDAGEDEEEEEEEEEDPQCYVDEYTCDNPRVLETVDGDSSGMGQPHSVKAYRPGWYVVPVKETNKAKCDGSKFWSVVCKAKPGRRMRLAVALASPSNTNYDFDYYYFPYHGHASDICGSSPVGSSDQVGETTDEASINWGEGAGDNLEDDSLNVLIHVRLASERCSPDREFTLSFTGSPDENCNFYVCPN